MNKPNPTRLVAVGLVTMALILDRVLCAQPSQEVHLSWDASAGSFSAESAGAITGTWEPIPGTSVETNGRKQMRAELLRTERRGEAVFIDAINYFDARDRGPSISTDGLSLYSCTDITGDFDIWMTTRKSLVSPWEPPMPIDEINTLGDEVFPTLSADGLSLFFSYAFSIASTRPGNLGSADLWVSMRESLNAPWQPPVHLGSVVNRPATDSGMAISTDGKTIIFVSDRRGGLGGFDLWITTRDDVSNPQGWQVPVNLGAPVNSSGSESGPALSQDGLALFFSSNRSSPGRPSGLNNIWVARRRTVAEPFGEPMSLGSFFREFSGMFDPRISADGRTLFFSSVGLISHPAPFGDIWQVPVETVLDSARFFRLQPGFAEARMVDAPLPVGNLDSRDRGPCFSAAGLSLFFCSDVSGNMDLWVMTRTSQADAWQQPVALHTINTLDNEAFPAVSSDGLSLLFSDWFLFEGTPRPGGSGNGDLWMSTRGSLNDPWLPPINMGPVVNSAFGDSTPTLSGDGLTLIFASDRPGNVPGSGNNFAALDLWMTTRSDPSDPMGWTAPVNLGSLVNSISADWSPSLSPDGLVLFFSSGRPGMGRQVGNNIWMTRRKSVLEPFGTPVSLEPHFLDVGNMLDPCIAPDGSALLFATHGLLADPFPREFVDLWQAAVVQPPPLSISFDNPPIHP